MPTPGGWASMAKVGIYGAGPRRRPIRRTTAMGARPRESRRLGFALVAAGLAGPLVILPASGQEPGAGLKEAAQAFARRQVEASFRAMNRPFPPFRIMGNLYYVGASDVASY